MKLDYKSRIGVISIAGFATAALLIPVSAIEKPADAEAPKEKQARPNVIEQAPKEARKPTQKVAMLGVGGMAITETLSLHLGLEKGSGLTIYHVVGGSAAEKCGLKKHDILTEFDGKKISSQQDLREAVQARKPGDEVDVKFISRGKAHEKMVSLGEREELQGMVQIPGINRKWLNEGLGGNIPPAAIPQINEDMMKRLRQMQQLQGAEKLDIGKLLREAIDGKRRMGGIKFGASTSISLMDNDGSVTLNTKDGNKSVIVKDKGGKVLFDGPYETEQDKAAVPDEMKKRLERLNIDKRDNGIKLRLLPMDEDMPLAEEAEDDTAG